MDGKPHRNHIVLVGRVTAEPALRELPSGDHVATWRVTVTRPPQEQRSSAKVDAVNCFSFDPRLHAATRDWQIGDVVEVSGALRRRFWRTAAGVSSVFEVEAQEAARIAEAAVAHQPS